MFDWESNKSPDDKSSMPFDNGYVRILIDQIASGIPPGSVTHAEIWSGFMDLVERGLEFIPDYKPGEKSQRLIVSLNINVQVSTDSVNRALKESRAKHNETVH